MRELASITGTVVMAGDERLTELKAELIAVRDGDYGSKLERNGARLTELERVVLELLERLARQNPVTL